MGFPVSTRALDELITPAIWNADLVENMNSTLLHPVFARTIADQSNSTTSFADLTGFSFPIGASEGIWVVRLNVVHHVGGTEDAKTTWTVPSGATGRQWYHGGSLGEGSVAIGTDLVEGSTGTADYTVEHGAIIVNSTTPGTCQWRFAQYAGGAEASIIRANAVMIAERTS